MQGEQDGAAVVADRRRGPFCYQTHAALDRVRAHFDGQKRVTALAIYLAFTEAANRAGGAGARDGFDAARTEIAEGVGVSVDTLDRYARELERIGLLAVERHQIGKINLPNTWVLLDPAEEPPPAPPSRTGAATPSRTGAAPRARSSSEPKKTNEEEDLSDDEKLANPPKLVRVEGRNLALDALAETCALTVGEPGYGAALGFLNGRKGKGAGAVPEAGINWLAWQELVGWAEGDEARRRRVLELHDEPEDWQRLLERMIRDKARRYREQMPDVFLTAKALRDWWLRLERLETLVGGRGVTAADITGAIA